jgi:hypothetical protein
MMQKNIYKMNFLKIIILAAVLFGTFSVSDAQDFIYVKPSEIGKPLPPLPKRFQSRIQPLQSGMTVRVNHPTARIIIGEVTEITPAFLMYKKDGDTTDILYVTPTINIDSVVFADGSVQIFKKERRERIIPERKLIERAKYANLGSNIITGSLGAFLHRIRFFTSEDDPDFTPFVKGGFSYERIFLDNKIGVEIAPFASFNKKGYGGMLHAKFYPAKPSGHFRIGAGPFYGLYIRDKTAKYYGSGYKMEISREVAMSVMGLGAQFQWYSDRNWFTSININFGGVTGYSNKNKQYLGVSKNGETGTGYGEFRFGVGYRF